MHRLILKKYHFIDNYNLKKFNNLGRDTCLIWRSKHAQKNIDLIVKTALLCKRKKIKFYLANNFKLAIKLKLDGVYISAFNKNFRGNCYLLKKQFNIIGSAHNQQELSIKKKQNVKEIFLSPIFKTKAGKHLGIYSLKNLFNNFSGKKIALGGINKKNIKLLRLVGFDGFAGIKYFE